MKISLSTLGPFSFADLAREVEALIPGIAFQDMDTKPKMIYAAMTAAQHRAIPTRLRKGGYRVSAYQGPQGFRKDGRWYTTDRFFAGPNDQVRISPQVFVSDPDKTGVAYIFGCLVKYQMPTKKD